MDLSSLRELQKVVGQYTSPAQIALAGGPLAGSMAVRLFAGKSKILRFATFGSGAWLAVKTVSGPVLGLITEQFGSLHQVFSGFGA